MKKLAIILFLGGFIAACGGGAGSDVQPTGPDNSVKTADNGNPSYDPERGEGKFTKVEVGDKLDVSMAEAGEKVDEVECNSCHQATDEKLVGPAWKGLTSRHTSELILYFSTNTVAMLDKDPKAQAQLKI